MTTATPNVSKQPEGSTPLDVPQPASEHDDTREREAGPEVKDDALGSSAGTDSRTDGSRGPHQGRPSAGARTRTDRSRTDPPTREQAEDELNRFNNIFNGNTYILGSSVGSTGPAPGAGARQRAATGWLTPDDVEAARAHFVTPDGFQDAATELAVKHVVVLVGRPGSGRRTAALALLREVTGGALAALSPATSLKQLGERQYEKGVGYVVADKLDESVSPELSEFFWESLRSRLREANSYLVVTAATTPTGVPTGIRPVTWQPPPALAVLRARVTLPEAVKVTETAAALISDKVRMSDLVRLAEGLQAGESPTAATSHILESDRRRVCEWFDSQHSRWEVLEVIALAFLEGVTLREYESRVHRLAELVDARLPLKRPPGKGALGLKDVGVLPTGRRGRSDHELLIVERVVSGGLPTSQVRFRNVGVGRAVIAEAWNRFDGPVWEALALWAYEIVLVDAAEPVYPLAQGLAALAGEAFEEVEGGYLLPWSRGELGAAGQEAAALVLAALSFDESLHPLSLHLATQWASHGTAAQRWTAALALSGVLGLRYPTDAIGRVWQLARQDEFGEVAAAAVGQLFSTMVTWGDPAPLLKHLRHQVEVTRPTGQTQRRHRAALRCVLGVLNAPAPGERHPVAAVLIRDQPEHLPALAELWAATLVNRRSRRPALQQVVTVLRALQRLSQDPQRDAERLGRGLAAALPVLEWPLLRRELIGMDRARTRGVVDDRPLVIALLSALEVKASEEPS